MTLPGLERLNDFTTPLFMYKLELIMLLVSCGLSIIMPSTVKASFLWGELATFNVFIYLHILEQYIQHDTLKRLA